MKYLLICLVIFCAFLEASAQSRTTGKISYVTGQNIYVRFVEANNIQLGDSVFIRRDNQEQLLFVVESKSSLSCMGKPFQGMKVLVGEEVFWKTERPEPVADKVPVDRVEPSGEVYQVEPPKPKSETLSFKEKIKGRVAASSYSSFSGSTDNSSHRLRYTLSLLASNINDSRFSTDTYVTFTHQASDWAAVKENLFSALKIYSLAVRYQPGELSSVWLGRKLNPNLSSIGAIDGVQYETGFNNFRLGAVVGFRPDYRDYGFNSDLLEYGAYLGYEYTNKIGSLQSSVAFFEQQNQGKTDRRFIYIQHSNSLLKNLFFFLSSELDLYKLQDGLPQNTVSLTSLYVSFRYRVSRQLSLYTSYDARKNVIYFETFKNMIDQLLEDATRQGVQFRVNYRPTSSVSVGLNTTYRMRDSDARANKTVNGFVSFTKLPWLDATATLSANILQTSYLDGQIFGLRLYKDLLNGKLYSSVGYRYVDYNYTNTSSSSLQHIGEFDLTWQISRKISLSADYEGTFEQSANYNRVYLNLTKRF